MELCSCPYSLQSGAGLNARSTREELAGVLLRVDHGYACLQPWPELGDPPLGVLLEDLVGARSQPLVVAALGMAAEDGRFRELGRSLLENVSVESHATLVEPDTARIERIVGQGFGVVKVKGGRNWEALVDSLGEWWGRFPEVQWRVDFNEVLSAEEVMRFSDRLGDAGRSRIDFLEDPCRYDAEVWTELQRESGLSLAMDTGVRPDSVADVLVLKPARELIDPFLEGEKRLVVTSAMDHPLGQCWAAAMAQRLSEHTGRVDLCGLQTHTLFSPTTFSKTLNDGPWFGAVPGTGLGFDDLLEEMPWSPL